jgi:hypothetical protein
MMIAMARFPDEFSRTEAGHLPGASHPCGRGFWLPAMLSIGSRACSQADKSRPAPSCVQDINAVGKS